MLIITDIIIMLKILINKCVTENIDEVYIFMCKTYEDLEIF